MNTSTTKNRIVFAIESKDKALSLSKFSNCLASVKIIKISLKNHDDKSFFAKLNALLLLYMYQFTIFFLVHLPFCACFFSLWKTFFLHTLYHLSGKCQNAPVGLKKQVFRFPDLTGCGISQNSSFILFFFWLFWVLSYPVRNRTWKWLKGKRRWITFFTLLWFQWPI